MYLSPALHCGMTFLIRYDAGLNETITNGLARCDVIRFDILRVGSQSLCTWVPSLYILGMTEWSI